MCDALVADAAMLAKRRSKASGQRADAANTKRLSQDRAGVNETSTGDRSAQPSRPLRRPDLQVHPAKITDTYNGISNYQEKPEHVLDAVTRWWRMPDTFRRGRWQLATRADASKHQGDYRRSCRV